MAHNRSLYLKTESKSSAPQRNRSSLWWQKNKTLKHENNRGLVWCRSAAHRTSAERRAESSARGERNNDSMNHLLERSWVQCRTATKRQMIHKRYKASLCVRKLQELCYKSIIMRRLADILYKLVWHLTQEKDMHYKDTAVTMSSSFYCKRWSVWFSPASDSGGFIDQLHSFTSTPQQANTS